MSLSIKDFFVLFAIGALVILLYSVFAQVPIREINFPSWNLKQDTTEKDMQEITNIIALGYQVDVEVNSAHIVGHSTSSAALRCMNNNGNVSSFSEFDSRRIHLLCWDEKTQTLYDIVINRINYYVQKYSNPKSQLITAYAPDGVNGVGMLEKVSNYVAHLSKTIGGKIVNLKFGPGEVAFMPK